MKVKICGITNYEDAALAVDQGVDALGFNFFRPSPRYLEPAAARSIIRSLPPFVIPVGVFVNVPTPEEVMRTAQNSGVRVLQLHGDESPEFCSRLADWPVIKVLRLGKGPVPGNLTDFSVSAFLLDAEDKSLFGGTGKTFDWTLAQGIKKILPIILAGGLTPENVGQAILAVRPYGVDVASGVESRPGKKDSGKLALFMNEVRNASRRDQP